MKIFTDRANNLTIRTYGDGEVDLPTLDDVVELTYYDQNGLIEIRRKSDHSAKLIPCDDADTLIRVLTAAEPSRETANGRVGKSAAVKNKPCKADGNSGKAPESIDYSAFDVDPDTGEVIEPRRSYEGLRRSWKRQCEYAKSSACWRLTRFCTCTVDTKPTYSQLNTIVAAFCKWLVRNYTDLLDNCFIFLEPCGDGSWHVHFLIAMLDRPLTFDDEVKIKEWWARKNTKPCDDQVQFAEPFESVDDLLRVLDYLKPTSMKKRHRIKHYPQSCQPMRHIGNVVEPNKALAKFEVAKEILGEEKQERRRAVEVKQTDTGVMLYSCQEYLFVSRIATADSGKVDCFRCKDGELKERYEFGSLIKYRECICAENPACPNYGRCELCAAQYTSFCEICIFNSA